MSSSVKDAITMLVFALCCGSGFVFVMLEVAVPMRVAGPLLYLVGVFTAAFLLLSTLAFAIGGINTLHSAYSMWRMRRKYFAHLQREIEYQRFTSGQV